MSELEKVPEVTYAVDPRRFVSCNRAFLKSNSSTTVKAGIRSSLYYGFLILVTSGEVGFIGSQFNYLIGTAAATLGGLIGGFLLPRRVAIRTAEKSARLLSGQEFIFRLGENGWTHVRQSGMTTFVPWKATTIVFQDADGWVIHFEDKDMFVPRKEFREAGLEEALMERI